LNMSTKPFIGCIADDFTGATDLANQFVRAGMRVVQTIGVPDTASLSSLSRYDVLVVALKSRTIAPEEAVRQSLHAYDWLQRLGCQQFYFKVCSTFDSTPQGNIGPVTEALIQATGEDLVLVTPAFPENLRSVYQGHLFVGSQLLHETGMRDHPLTPMTDSNLVRVLQAQTALPVGLISHAVVSQGSEAVRARIQSLRAEGYRMAIGDAVSNHDLMVLGLAVQGRRLVTAGSGLAIGLPQNFSFSPAVLAESFPRSSGAQAVVSGSCSQATQRQVQAFISGGGQAWRIDPLRLHSPQVVADDALRWAEPRIGQAPILIYSTAPPRTWRRCKKD
jgi:3-dehydrotetronate 4-kinase